MHFGCWCSLWLPNIIETPLDSFEMGIEICLHVACHSGCDAVHYLLCDSVGRHDGNYEEWESEAI